jgi:hypothetical protein
MEAMRGKNRGEKLTCDRERGGGECHDQHGAAQFHVAASTNCENGECTLEGGEQSARGGL